MSNLNNALLPTKYTPMVLTPVEDVTRRPAVYFCCRKICCAFVLSAGAHPTCIEMSAYAWHQFCASRGHFSCCVTVHQKDCLPCRGGCLPRTAIRTGGHGAETDDLAQSTTCSLDRSSLLAATPPATTRWRIAGSESRAQAAARRVRSSRCASATR